jgi:hypothetical protein
VLGAGSTSNPEVEKQVAVDYQLFKTYYDDFNGPGAFEEMVFSVPEPSSMAMFAAGLLGASYRRRRQA